MTNKKDESIFEPTTTTTELTEDELRAQYEKRFVQEVGHNVIAGVPEREGWTRKAVITNYSKNGSGTHPELARNVERHLDLGFRVVLDTVLVRDDRAFGPNMNKQPNRVPAPITGDTTDGYKYVVMEIENSKLEEKMKEKKAKDQLRYLQTIEAKVTRKGGHVDIDGGEFKI